MPGIFISYRREDSSGYSGRLFDILSDRFGRHCTFMDLDTIQGGDLFAGVIEERVAQCDVLLAIIDPRWLSVTGADGVRRLDRADDFVRLEIAKALGRGVRVIPVLVGRAALPAQDELPGELRPLALRQSVELRDAYFRADAERLVAQLGPVLGAAGHHAGHRNAGRIAVAAGAVLALAGVLGGGILLRHSMQPGSSPVSTEPAERATSQVPSTVSLPPAAATRPVEVPKAKPAQVAGRWSATVTYDWPGAVYDETFNLQVDGGELSGTASLLGTARGIVSGSVEGARIRFTTKTATELADKIYQDTHLYKGTVAGDTIHFSMLTESEIDSHVPVSFEAHRVPLR